MGSEKKYSVGKKLIPRLYKHLYNVWAEKIPEKDTMLRNFNDCALLKLSKDPLLKHFYFSGMTMNIFHLYSNKVQFL